MTKGWHDKRMPCDLQRTSSVFLLLFETVVEELSARKIIGKEARSLHLACTARCA